MLNLRRLFQRQVQDIAGATGPDEIKRQLIQLSSRLEFDTVSTMAVLDRSNGKTEFFSIHNMPQRYDEHYENTSMGQIDPVMQHCKLSSHPIAWNRETYAERGVGGLWEIQARYGLKSGIAQALHSPGGRHFFIGLDRDDASMDTPERRKWLFQQMTQFGRLAQAAAFEIFDPAGQEYRDVGDVTHMELECLRWSMDGQQAADIATKIGKDVALVHQFLATVTVKLHCSTRYQAGIKAIRMGLVRP